MQSPNSVITPKSSYVTPPLPTGQGLDSSTENSSNNSDNYGVPQIYVTNSKEKQSLKSSTNNSKNVTKTPYMADDPQTPSLANAQSELTDRPPQKPLPLPKMRNHHPPQQQEKSLFQSRNDRKRSQSQHTMMQSPSVAAIAAANYTQSKSHPNFKKLTPHMSNNSNFDRRSSGSQSTQPTPLFAVPPYPSYPQLPFTIPFNSDKHRSISTVSTLNGGGADDIEKGQTQDNFGRPICDVRLARLLLLFFVIFPPLWLLMGTGFMDEPIGVIPTLEKRLSILFALLFFVLVVIGVIVGFAVGT